MKTYSFAWLLSIALSGFLFLKYFDRVVASGQSGIQNPSGCPIMGEEDVLGFVENPFSEASSLIMSQDHYGRLYSMEDSFNYDEEDPDNPDQGKAWFAALDINGNIKARYFFEQDDWRPSDTESMSLGPGPNPNIDYIYIADIGQNQENWVTWCDPEDPECELTEPRILEIARIPEPENANGDYILDSDDIEIFYARYNINSLRNAEAFMVDAHGDSVIITKGPDEIFRAPPLQQGILNIYQYEGNVSMEGMVYGGNPLNLMATGADITPDGSMILLSSYNFVMFWTRIPGVQSIAEAMSAPPCGLPAQATPYGYSTMEAISFGYQTKGPQGQLVPTGYLLTGEDYDSNPNWISYFPAVGVTE